MAMDAASAMGSIALWGFSPAIDFTVEGSNPDAFRFWNEETCDLVSVLFVGAPDLSHILQNLPEALQRTDRPVDFCILENSVEVYARQLLLLWLLCEPPDSVGLQEKVWMFLEIVGNTLIRPSTARYIAETATKLIELVTGGDDCLALPPVSLAELRHRERDQLADVFQFWRSPDAKIDVAHMWDLRLRQQLAQRYDARHGVFDWDYFMRLKDRLDVEFVQPGDYKHWRETGVAFRRPGTEQTCVNRTLVTTRALGRPGERQLRRGYWGDIVSGPYAPFGLRSDDPSLSRKQNGRLAATAATVSAANLEALFSAMSSSLPSATHVRVRFLPADGGAALGRRAAYRQRFAAAVFSTGMSQLLTPSASACLRDGAAVILETARYIVCVTADQQGRLLERYGELANTAGCRPLREDVGASCSGGLGSEETAAVVCDDRGWGTGEHHMPGQNVHSLTKSEEKDQSLETETGENSSQSKGRSRSDTEINSGEAAVSTKIREPNAIVSEQGYCAPAGAATEEKKPLSAEETTKICDKTDSDWVKQERAEESPEDTDVGDRPDTLRCGKDEDSVLETSADYPRQADSGENGAGEPKIADVIPEKDSDGTTAEEQSEKSQSPVESAASQRKIDMKSEDSYLEKVDSNQFKTDVVLDNAGSSTGGTGKPPTGELGGSRRWASDKLASLPEWVCFVKLRAD